jgi:hypothetical protein
MPYFGPKLLLFSESISHGNIAPAVFIFTNDKISFVHWMLQKELLSSLHRNGIVTILFL